MDLEILLTNKSGQPMIGYDPASNRVVLLADTHAGGQIEDGGETGGPVPAPYREGVWTPRFTSTDGAEGQGYAAQVGRWVRVGGLVWIGGRLALETRGTFAGEVLVKGLPFPVAGVDGEDVGAISVSRFAGLTTTKYGLQGLPRADTGAIALLSTENAAASVPLVQADLLDTFAITFGGWYVAAA